MARAASSSSRAHSAAPASGLSEEWSSLVNSNEALVNRVSLIPEARALSRSAALLRNERRRYDTRAGRSLAGASNAADNGVEARARSLRVW